MEEIRAGEAFQIVVSQRFEVDTTADALDIYRVLRLTNPSPYMYLLRLPDFDIVGSSPEALVTVQDGTAITHPIAGSKPRGATPGEDAALETELLADPKERAEHVMLVDLGRNDLGRVCRPGTVEVVEFMDVRRYSHIMHLESTVTGMVAEDRSALDVLLAAFPAGTLSGAPKVRAMEIIDELEVSRRGLYGGVVGYLDFAGDADAAIAIRTALLRDGVAYVQAGGGIVADSDPPTEDTETRNKAAAVVRAISVAQTLPEAGRMSRRPLAAGIAARRWLAAGARGGLVELPGRATDLTRALALVALVGTVLILVLRARGRRVVGMLLAVLGLGMALAGVLLSEPTPPGGSATPFGGALVAARRAADHDHQRPLAGTGQPVPSRGRWAPRRTVRDPADLWRAMDAGLDPTADPDVRKGDSGDTMRSANQSQQSSRRK